MDNLGGLSRDEFLQFLADGADALGAFNQAASEAAHALSEVAMNPRNYDGLVMALCGARDMLTDQQLRDEIQHGKPMHDYLVQPDHARLVAKNLSLSGVIDAGTLQNSDIDRLLAIGKDYDAFRLALRKWASTGKWPS